MIPKYHINLFGSEPDGAWVVDVTDLRSCLAFGDPPVEALAEIELAIEARLAVPAKTVCQSRSPAAARRPAPPGEVVKADFKIAVGAG